MKLNKLHRKKYKLFIVIVIMVLLFIFMQVDTNSIIEEVYDAFYSTDCYLPKSYKDNYPDSYNDKPEVIFIDDNEFNDNIKSHFNWLYDYNNENYTIKLEVKKIYTIHNFRSGYIWLKYSVLVSDKYGDIITESNNIPVKMKIKKEKSIWEATKIFEKEGYAGIKDFLGFWIIGI